MGHSKEEILEKIRACFKLADPTRNSNEHEAAAALNMAKKLMESHRLSESEVFIEEEAQNQKIENSTPETRLHVHKYEWLLAVVCREMFDVKPFLNFAFDKEKKRNRKVLTFVGFPTDVALASEVFRILRDDINKMAMNCDYKESERDQYRVGVAERLFDRAKDFKVQLNAKCRDMVISKQAIIEQSIEKAFGKLKQGRATSSRLTDGRLKGRQDGNNVNLDFSNKVKHTPSANKLLPR